MEENDGCHKRDQQKKRFHSFFRWSDCRGGRRSSKYDAVTREKAVAGKTAVTSPPFGLAPPGSKKKLPPLFVEGGNICNLQSLRQVKYVFPTFK